MKKMLKNGEKLASIMRKIIRNNQKFDKNTCDIEIKFTFKKHGFKIAPDQYPCKKNQ